VRVIALTFDTEYPDRPCSGGALELILSTLSAARVRATFFVQGRWARSSPDDARRISSAGHLIGNHSHHHAPMDSLTEAGFRADVSEAEAMIREVTGVDPRPWFRCPFGAGMDDPEVLRRLEEMGYVNVGWDVDPRDWHEKSDAEAVTRVVLEGVHGLDASIVLLHSWPDATAEALPFILDGLADTGAELVDVETLSR
jgi:peptidoglycan/xylan/chitin deacetylase (PgdA/CDA1 family)